MKQTYTEEKLIQFIYGECDIIDRLEIEDALDHDQLLKDAHTGLMDAFKLLPPVKMSPERSTIENILAYSKRNCIASC